MDYGHLHYIFCILAFVLLCIVHLNTSACSIKLQHYLTDNIAVKLHLMSFAPSHQLTSLFTVNILPVRPLSNVCDFMKVCTARV